MHTTHFDKPDFPPKAALYVMARSMQTIVETLGQEIPDREKQKAWCDVLLLIQDLEGESPDHPVNTEVAEAFFRELMDFPEKDEIGP